MKKIFFLVNSMDEYDFGDLIEKHLKGVSVDVGDSLPRDTNKYDLVVLWSHKKIIPGISAKKNIVIFHSTDLPEGKGWAPIYNTVANGKGHFVISGLLPAEKADEGDIVVKARFKIKDNYTARVIREWDREISIMLAKEILNRFKSGEIKGVKQDKAGSFYARRKPGDNMVSEDSRLCDIINHLRACEDKHPAFFYHNDIKYIIRIEPESRPDFPKDLKIEFLVKGE